jgi:hypothetical protein
MKYSSEPNSTLLDPKILPTQDTPKPLTCNKKQHTKKSRNTLPTTNQTPFVLYAIELWRGNQAFDVTLCTHQLHKHKKFTRHNTACVAHQNTHTNTHTQTHTKLPLKTTHRNCTHTPTVLAQVLAAKFCVLLVCACVSRQLHT